MEETSFARDGKAQIDRRNLLKLAGGAAGGSLAVTAVGSARNKNANGNGNGNGGGKQGGRGQTSDPVHLNEPFTVEFKEYFDTNASCQSDQSEEVHYTRYYFEYCNIDVEPTKDYKERKTLCVRPGRSDVNEDRVYEFRSKQECKAPSSQFQHRFSFGPTNSEHDCDE